MRRRRVALFAICFLLGCASLALLWWSIVQAQSVITEHTFARIEIGMTIAEVEAIMGGQPRDESTGSLAAAEGVKDSKELATEQARWFRLERLGEPADFERAIRPDIWASDEVIIRVYYSRGKSAPGGLFSGCL